LDENNEKRKKNSEVKAKKDKIRSIFKMKRVIILGGGTTGLVTGLGLAERGIKVEIFESSKIPGGQTASEEIDGMYFDYGPHIFHTHHDEIRQLWKDSFGDLLIEKEFFYKNYKDGVFYDYPLSFEAIEKLRPELRDRVKKELQQRKPENLKRARNFKECVIALVGPTLQDIFFEGYTRKLWGIPTEKMSANWAPKRIEIRKKHKGFWAGQFSAAPKYGSGKIMQRMCDQIVAGGDKIYLEHKINRLNVKNSRITSIEFDNGKVIEIGNAVVVSTIPLVTLCDLLGVKCNLQFNSLILVYAIFRRREVFPENVHSIYFAHDDFYFHRVTEQRKYSDEGYPKDRTLLCYEISYTGKPFLAKMKEEKLISEVLDQFCSVGMVKKKDFVKGFTRKVPFANPIMEYGYEIELARVQSIVSLISNLHTVGGGAEFIYGDVQVMFAKARDMVDLLTSKHYVINKNIKSGAPFGFNEEVLLCDSYVGKNNPPIIIADIGLNHNGDMEMAEKLIYEAKRSGCSIAKFQTFSAGFRVSKTSKSARYADKTLQMEETTYDMFKRLELSYEDHVILFEYSKKVGIPLISTPFDEESVDLLYNLGVNAFKVASFDIVNLPFLKYVASKRLPIILSTGMSSLSEVEEALDAIASEENPNVILLHCVSTYPCSPSDVNLKAIDTLKTAFKVPVGFSDHTVGNLCSIVAMAIGTHAIERHFTLDKRFEGPDHILSLDPQEMERLVAEKDTIISSLGNGIKKPASSEYSTINVQRKSIHAACSIKAGEKLTLDNITVKGPGHGLFPKYFQLILEKRVTRDIDEDSPLMWDDILVG